MQTFLPSPDFAESARALDDRRLGKQRVEVLQIVRALTVPGYAWRNHPAVLMWAGHEEALEAYLHAVCDEWGRRGHADSCRATVRAELAGRGLPPPRTQAELAAAGALPAWVGDDAVHRSHRAALAAKDPERYGALWPAEELAGAEGYVWPVRSPAALEREATAGERSARTPVTELDARAEPSTADPSTPRRGQDPVHSRRRSS